MARGGRRDGAGRPSGTRRVCRLRVELTDELLAVMRAYATAAGRDLPLDEILRNLLRVGVSTVSAASAARGSTIDPQLLDRSDPLVAEWLRQCKF